MKYWIIPNQYHARSVRPDLSEYIFTISGRSCSPSLLLSLISLYSSYFVCQEEAEFRRGAERHPIRVVGVVVVGVAVVVHIAEVSGVARQWRAEPPVPGGHDFTEHNLYDKDTD